MSSDRSGCITYNLLILFAEQTASHAFQASGSQTEAYHDSSSNRAPLTPLPTGLHCPSCAVCRLAPWLVPSAADARCWSSLYFYCPHFLLPKRIATLKPIPTALVIPDSPTFVVHNPASATSETDLELLHVAAPGRSALTILLTTHRLLSRPWLPIAPSLWSPA
jgi:hypothetical protein